MFLFRVLIQSQTPQITKTPNDNKQKMDLKLTSKQLCKGLALQVH